MTLAGRLHKPKLFHANGGWFCTDNQITGHGKTVMDAWESYQRLLALCEHKRAESHGPLPSWYSMLPEGY